MRWSRVRLRTLLILILLTGVGFGGFVLWRRSAEFRRRAAQAESNEVFYTDLAKRTAIGADNFHRLHEEMIDFLQRPGNAAIFEAELRASGDSQVDLKSLEEKAQRDAADRRGIAEYHGRLKLKYRRAALYPWIAVEPDPPNPFWELLQQKIAAQDNCR